MARKCYSCERLLDVSAYSMNQRQTYGRKARCLTCVSGVSAVYKCPNCPRQFTNQNEVKMHMQVHLPKNVACIICGEVRFRSVSNSVAHVESGACSGCRGKENARQQIYGFAQQRAPELLAPMLTDSGHEDVCMPDRPYRCKYEDCGRDFKHMSSLLSHRADKHGIIPRPTGGQLRLQ